MKAEKEAQQIVAQARKYRQDKLKQAKSDASKEINDYKVQKDNELTQLEQQNEGNVTQMEQDALKDIETELEEIKKTTNDKQQHVVDLLIDAVIKPTGGIHINAQ